MEQHNGFPEKYHPLPSRQEIQDHIIGAALLVGRAVTRLTAQVSHEPRPSASDHWREPGASLKAQHQAEHTRMAQLELNYDANGSPVE